MPLLRFDRDARPDLLQSVDDDPLAGLQAVGDLPQAVVERPTRMGRDITSFFSLTT